MPCRVMRLTRLVASYQSSLLQIKMRRHLGTDATGMPVIYHYLSPFFVIDDVVVPNDLCLP